MTTTKEIRDAELDRMGCNDEPRKVTGEIWSWATKKQPNGLFTAIVRKGIQFDTPDENGSFLTFQTVKRIENIKTRTRAKGSAIRWRRYLKGLES